MRSLICLSLAACLVSAPASAADSPATKKVCKRVQPHETGSNLRKRSSRVCMTEAHWKQIDAETQQNVDEIRERSNIAPDDGSRPSTGNVPE